MDDMVGDPDDRRAAHSVDEVEVAAESGEGVGEPVASSASSKTSPGGAAVEAEGGVGSHHGETSDPSSTAAKGAVAGGAEWEEGAAHGDAKDATKRGRSPDAVQAGEASGKVSAPGGETLLRDSSSCDGNDALSGAASASSGDELRNSGGSKPRAAGGGLADVPGGMSARVLLGKPLKSSVSAAPKASSSVHKNGKPTHEYNIYSFFKATTPRPKSLLQSRGGGGGGAADGSSRVMGGIGGIGEGSASRPQCFRLQELWDWFDQPYGVEVPIVLKNIYYSVKSQTNTDGELPAFYVPHLSALVLFPPEGVPPRAKPSKGKVSGKPLIDVGMVSDPPPGVSAVTGGGGVRAWGKPTSMSWAALASKNPPLNEGEAGGGKGGAGGGAGGGGSGGVGVVQTGVGAWGRPGAWDSTLYWNQAWNSKPVTPPAGGGGDKGTWAKKVSAPKGSWVDVVSKEKEGGGKEKEGKEAGDKKEERAWGVGGQGWGDIGKEVGGAKVSGAGGDDEEGAKEGGGEGVAKEAASKEAQEGVAGGDVGAGVVGGAEEVQDDGQDGGKIPKISQRAANYIDDILKSSGVLPSTATTTHSPAIAPAASPEIEVSLPDADHADKQMPSIQDEMLDKDKTPMPNSQPEFEFYETRPPGERPPLWDCVNELAEGLVLDGVELHEPRLLTGLNTDFDTAKSWMAVAWYPILCHSTTAHAIKGSFITYHRFRFLDEGSKMRGAEEESGGSREEGGGGQAEGGAVGLEGMVKEVVGRMVDEAGQRAGAAMSSREAGAAAVSVAEDGTPLGEALPLEMSGYVHYKVVNVTWYAPRNRPGGMSSASNFVVPVYLFELAAVHSRTLCGFRTEDGDEGMHGGGEATVLRRGPHRDFEHIMAKFTNFETVLDLLSKQRADGKEVAGGSKSGRGGRNKSKGAAKSPRGGGRKASGGKPGGEGVRKTRSMPGSPSQKPRLKRPSNSPQIDPEPSPSTGVKALTRGVSLDRS